MDDNLIAAIFYSAVDPYAARHFFTNRCLWFNAFKHVVLTNQDQLKPGFNNKKSYVPIISARSTSPPFKYSGKDFNQCKKVILFLRFHLQNGC